jgi:hypothetical protein
MLKDKLGPKTRSSRQAAAQTAAHGKCQRDCLRYLRRVAVLTLIPALCILVNIVFIFNAGENTGFREIVAEQLATDGVYGTALSQNPYAHKMELVKAIKPEVLAVGSSRTMLFRRAFFTASFANAGGAVNYIAEGLDFLRELARFHKPKVVILGLDFWWFAGRYPQPKSFPYHDNDGRKLTFEKLTTPFTWLRRGDITVADYASILLTARRTNPVTNHHSLGVRAITRGDGFRADGSYLFGRLVFGFHDAFTDERFADTLRRVEAGTFQFVHDQGLDPERMAQLDELIRFCRDQGIRLVLVLPPITDAVYQAMMRRPERYGHLAALRRAVKTLPVEAYDFTEMSSLGSTDCECADGFHGGDVTYQRLLLKIAETNPGSALVAYLDTQRMRDGVAANAGHVLTKFDPGKYKYNETDFLKIGCPK